MTKPHPLLLLLFATLAAALDLASRCSNPSDNECPCSRRLSPALEFCLSTASHPTQCRQRACPARYVCDCSGDTVCRTAPIRTTLHCLTPVAATGHCQCERRRLSGQAGVSTTALIPLRPFGHVHRLQSYMPRDALFCSERPAFWADQPGQLLLTSNWRVLSSKHHDDAPPHSQQQPPVLRFGHFGHAVSFSAPQSLAVALRSTHDSPELHDDSLDVSALSTMLSECIAAHLSVMMAKSAVPTRPAAVVPYFDADRMVLQACPHLARDNPAVGMSVARVLQRAMLATGQFPEDDSALSHSQVAQACTAINRNFEACEVDLGCIAITS